MYLSLPMGVFQIGLRIVSPSRLREVRELVPCRHSAEHNQLDSRAYHALICGFESRVYRRGVKSRPRC